MTAMMNSDISYGMTMIMITIMEMMVEVCRPDTTVEDI
jgi:hypothetical protein